MEALSVSASWAAVFANAAAAIFIAIQARSMARSLKLTKSQNEHTLCIEVWKHYNLAFSDRQWLMANPICLDEIRQRYGSDDAVFDSDEYKKLRRVAAVYGMAASLIRTGAIDGRLIFDYISVPAKLWDLHWPFIQYVRERYYSQLFVGWQSLHESPHNIWKAASPAGERRPDATSIPTETKTEVPKVD